MFRKTKPDYAAQPSVAAILKMMQRARGATAAEIAMARDLEPHTVRAVRGRRRALRDAAGEVRYARDCVAKLKIELTAKFRAAPVALDIRQWNASQRAYEGCRLKIGLIM